MCSFFFSFSLPLYVKYPHAHTYTLTENVIEHNKKNIKPKHASIGESDWCCCGEFFWYNMSIEVFVVGFYFSNVKYKIHLQIGIKFTARLLGVQPNKLNSLGGERFCYVHKQNERRLAESLVKLCRTHQRTQTRIRVESSCYAFYTHWILPFEFKRRKRNYELRQ